MSLSTWVQLFRNLFCVLKSLLPASSIFQQPYFIHSNFYPLTVTTPIELLIAPTQFAAVVFNALTGYDDFEEGLANYIRIGKWLSAIDRVFVSGPVVSTGAEYLIIKGGLERDRIASRRTMIVGIFEMIFGVAFLFLVLNTLHIVGPSHPKPLVDAVISMEIGLAYILIIMWKTFFNRITNGYRLQRLAGFMKDLKELSISSILTKAIDSGYKGNELFEVIMALDKSYTPLWRVKESPIDNKQAVKSIKFAPVMLDIRKEFNNLTAMLNKLTKIDSKIENNKSLKSQLVGELNKQAIKSIYFQAPLDFTYFLLNFIAGYGYLLGILAFYIPETKEMIPIDIFELINSIINTPNMWCKCMMFGMRHSDADWWGNLAGDFAWTLEPIIVLLSSVTSPIITYLTNLPTSVSATMSIINAEKTAYAKNKVASSASATSTTSTAIKSKDE